MDILLVIDMQRDFIDGALGTPQAQAIVEPAARRAEDFDGMVIFTRDTHQADYLDTQEGRNLPVAHCVYGTPGWQIHPRLAPLCRNVVDKPAFGSAALVRQLEELNGREPIGQITLIGLCTDICVISNALLIKSFLPETPVCVDASCCAGVTVQRHLTALEAMRACQIQILEAPPSPALMLVRPDASMRQAVWAYRRECLDQGEGRINGSCGLALYDSYDRWLQTVHALEAGTTPGEAPASTFLTVRKSDGRIVGTVQLRHCLTDALKRHGGHIGYEIRPSLRRRGYGKAQLRLALREAAARGMDRVMVSCDRNNRASARTIESCGGVFDHEEPWKDSGERIYWIDLKQEQKP